MHDPMTVAFAIKYPWRSRPSSLFPKGYRNTFITIWHVDPERDAHDRGTRADDSCGWFHPPTTPWARNRIRKLGEQQYSTIFEKQARTAEGASYAYVCYEPTAYDAIYWAWRAIKNDCKKQALWQYGCQRHALTAAELEQIFMLYSCPVDNLRMSVAEVKDKETCGVFFLTLYRCYLRFNRPWYRHPRWHFWHWSVRVEPISKVSRWLFSRCAFCKGRFTWNEQRYGNWGGTAVWHERCNHHAYADRKMPEESPSNVYRFTGQERGAADAP